MRQLAATLGLLAVLAGASCGSVPRTNYYTLRVPSPPETRDPKTTFLLGVEHFRATEMLRDDRIVYYESPTELNYYQYQRWGAAPATMLTQVTARQLDQMGIFTEVRVLPSREPMDYILTGRVLNYEEVDYEGGGKGRVALELTLVRSRNRQIVWSFHRQAERAIEERGVAGVVNALNAATQDLLQEALAGLTAHVEHDFAESQKHPQ